MTRRGFTFIEVLFALFITAGIVLAVSSTVILSLRAEAVNRERHAAAHLWTTLHTVHRLKTDPDATGEYLPAAWQATHELIQLGTAPTQTMWEVYHITGPERIRRTPLALRATP